ncbi:hypothetical protein [Streptomyces sp. NPDC046197]|uniref:hypothetical protein n=1 Tax=Streptomyces sp. NPDC046197 TaxID=3154337 RepID=UPI0033F42D23
MKDRTQSEPRTWSALLPAAIGLLLLLLSAVLFAVVPGALADKDAYAAAPACPARTAGTGSHSCTTTVPATVAGKDDEPHGKSVQYWLLARERGAHTVLRIRMTGDRPVYDAVRAGDGVTLTYWRGEIRAVGFGAANQKTYASPDDDWRLPTAIGLMALPLGLGFFSTGCWYRRSGSRPRRIAPWGIALWQVSGMLLSCVGFIAGITADGVGQAFLITAAGIPPSVGLAGLYVWWIRRRVRRAADTSDIVPVLPTEKRRVRATVHGEVPYSVDGFNQLVVGDGRPLTTPDPTGRFAGRPLPETLKVRNARSLEPGDPAVWYEAYKYDAIVIEAQDGDQPVLVVTTRRDAPLVLGALSSPQTDPVGRPWAP